MAYTVRNEDFQNLVIKRGRCLLPEDTVVKIFDEDDGWVDITIPAGGYHYRILDFNGWHPKQLLVTTHGETGWLDICDTPIETENLYWVEANGFGVTLKLTPNVDNEYTARDLLDQYLDRTSHVDGVPIRLSLMYAGKPIYEIDI